MGSKSDHELIAELNQRHRHALGDVFDRYSADLYDFTYRVIGDRDQAVRLLEEIFERLPSATSKLSEQVSLRGWLYSLARDLALNFLRQKDGLEELLATDEPGVPGLVGDIWNTPRTMPAFHRAVLVIEELHGLSPTEKARALGVMRTDLPRLVEEATKSFNAQFDVLARQHGRPASNRAYILEHISYRILDTYLTYKLSLYYKFNDINVYTQTNTETGNTFSSNYIGKYRQIFYGGSLSVGTQLEKFGKLIFTGKYQYDEIKNKEGTVVSPYETKIVSLRIGGIVDDQNKYPYPENGLYFNGFYETAQSFLGGDEGYLSIWCRSEILY